MFAQGYKVELLRNCLVYSSLNEHVIMSLVGFLSPAAHTKIRFVRDPPVHFEEGLCEAPSPLNPKGPNTGALNPKIAGLRLRI